MDDIDIPSPNSRSNKKDLTAHMKFIIVSCSFMIFFTILFFCSYFIPRNEYLDMRKQFSDLEFLEPLVSAEALHWTNYCTWIGLCVFAIIISFERKFCFCLFFGLLITVVIFFLADIAFWVAYPCVVASSSLVSSAWDHQLSYSLYQHNMSAMLTESPFIKISATGISIKNKLRGSDIKYYCIPESIIIRSKNFTTFSYLPELEGYYSWSKLA